MKRLSFSITLFALLVLTTACENDSLAPFASHYPSVEERFNLSQEYNWRNGDRVDTLYAKADDYKIYVCSDTHIAVPYYAILQAQWNGPNPMMLSKLATFISLYRADTLCPAALCLGDLVESDITYESFRYPLDSLPLNPAKWDTMFCTIGNHDVFYRQYEAYRYWISPTSVYSFVIKTPSGKHDLYICLDTATGSLGRNQMNWLRNTLSEANVVDNYWNSNKFRHIIVYTHVNIFRRDNTSADISTTALEETYELMSLFQQYGVKQFWAGHDHSREEFTQGGVKYIIVDSMEESNGEAAFMILHVGDELNNTFHTIYSYKQ